MDIRKSWKVMLVLVVMGLVMQTMAPSPTRAQDSGPAFIQTEVASVNGQVFTERELFFTMMREFGPSIIDDLVENALIASQAESLGVTIGDNEIEDYLSTAYTQEKRNVLINAFGRDTIEKSIGIEILAFNTVGAKIDEVIKTYNINVDDELIRNFYLQNLPLWAEPATVRFSMIECATQSAAQAAYDRISGGELFEDVCIEVSTHELTRIYGGDIGAAVPKGYSEGERMKIEDAAFGQIIGDITAPFESDGKWYVIKTTAKTEYREPTLEELYDTIHASLLDREVQPYLEQWRTDLWQNADIDVAYPVYIDTFTSTFQAGADGSFIAPVVAVVNSKEITETQLFFHLLRDHGSEVIETVIEYILLTQEGTRQGLSVTTADARSYLQSIYPSEKLQVLDAAFTNNALDQTMLHELSAVQMMGARIEEIVNEYNIEVTDDEILNYYLQNLTKWSNPDMVRFSMIMVATQNEATAARARIVGGETFAAVCRDVSIEEGTRAHDGDIGDYIPKGIASGVNSIIEDTAFGLNIGEVSQPFQVGANWMIIKVTDKVDAYEPSLSEMREEIYTLLLREKVLPFLVGWQKNLWDSSDINVTYPIYKETD
jgi:foldase protein PrsA